MMAIGIDHGTARIGLAISDALGMLAHPLETVPATPAATALKRIAEVAAARGVSLFVIGMPRNMDGSHGPAAEKVRAFGVALRAQVPGCTIKFVDERLTTVAAQKTLHAGGKNTKQSRGVIDQVAAQMILQIHLDSEAMRAP